jgi:hypothetical protein
VEREKNDSKKVKEENHTWFERNFLQNKKKHLVTLCGIFALSLNE